MKKRWIVSLFITASLGSFMFTVATPTTVSAAEPACTNRFLGLPAWYRGLVDEITCEVKEPDAVGGLSPFIWRIGLNVLEMALWLAGYIAVFFVMYGGFQLFASEGIVDKRVKAQKTIINALIGLALSIISVAVVTFVVGRLGI